MSEKELSAHQIALDDQLLHASVAGTGRVDYPVKMPSVVSVLKTSGDLKRKAGDELDVEANDAAPSAQKKKKQKSKKHSSGGHV
jgi:hypothetical protein